MTQQTTYAAALREALKAGFEADPTRIFLGEDIAAPGEAGGVFGISSGFLEAFGSERVINTPISESGFLGMAVGAAMTGLKPVAEIMFCDFLGVALDPLLSAASKARFLSGGDQDIPLIVRTTMGAGDGSGAVHSQSLPHLLASIAGLSVALPGDVESARQVVDRALGAVDPVVIFEHKGLYGSTARYSPLEGSPLEMQILRKGGDVTLIATSAMVHEAMTASETLAERGIETTVLNPVWISGPLSIPAIEVLTASVRKTGHVLILDEGAVICGLGDWLLKEVTVHAFDALKAAPVLITPPHSPVPYAPALEAEWLPSAKLAVEAALDLRGTP